MGAGGECGGLGGLTGERGGVCVSVWEGVFTPQLCASKTCVVVNTSTRRQSINSRAAD